MVRCAPIAFNTIEGTFVPPRCTAIRFERPLYGAADQCHTRNVDECLRRLPETPAGDPVQYRCRRPRRRLVAPDRCAAHPRALPRHERAVKLRPDVTISPRDLSRGQSALVKDAAWASLTGSLYGGVILTGFALALGAGPFVIGLLAAIPLIAQTAQLPAIALVERVRQRRKIAVTAVTAARVLILALALVPLLAAEQSRLGWLVGMQFAITVLGSITACALNSWLHQLLPREGLGAFFARRLFWATSVACVGTLAAGFLIDHWPFGERLRAYSFAFAAAAMAGFVSSWYLSRVPEPPMTGAGPAATVVSKVVSPFRDPKFRSVIVYIAAWNGASNMAAPFLAVYLLEQLAFPLSTVTTLWVTSQVANAVTLYAWGRISDRLSNKAILDVALPLHFACLLALAFVANFTGHAFTLPLLYAIHLAMGAAGGGITLATGNMSLKLAPHGQGTAYLAATSLVASVTGGVAAIVAGSLAQWFQSAELSVIVRWAGGASSGEVSLIEFARWQFLFVISALLGLYVLHALSRISEGEQVSQRVVMQHFALEALRAFNGISSVAGPLGNLFSFGRLIERRLYARWPAAAQSRDEPPR
jgi:MFS family permease